MAWLSGYEYRKKGAVNATTAGAQTNYQFELIVGESSGASGEDVDCESLCQDFPNDIRFTKEDGETKHDYWVESIEGTTPNRKATVIIEVSAIPASGSVDFYMYYGKSADAGESDGGTTFLAFDDASEYEQEIHHNTNVYSPAVTKLDNGNLLLIYYGRSALWQKLYESTDHGASWSLKSTPDASSHIHPDITSYGNNDVWICSNGSGNITSRKSSDGGSTWASEVNIASDTDRDDSAILYINASLLLCAIQYKASPYEIEIYKSINGGTSWSFVVNAVTGSVKYEDIVLEIAPNDDIVLAYEKEWVEGGHAGIYCVKSSNNGTTWGSEITIYDDGSADNEGGAMLTDGSDMYYFFPTDEDKGSGSYKENNVKRMKSTDNGATWGNKTLVLDTKFTTEPDIIKAGNGDILFFGCRQYPSASYIFQVEIDMSSPKLFGTGWTQDYGLVYSILDSTDKVLAVEGRIDQAKRAFVANSLNVADCKIEYSGKTTGTAFDTRSVFRYTDVNNHYQVNHSPTNMNSYERVSGTYSLLDSDASTGVVDTWYAYKIQVLGTNIKTWVDGNARNDINDSSFTIGKTGLSCSQTATKHPCLFKDYRVSKHVSPEPTWGTWGNQQCLLQGAVSTTSSVSGTCSVSWKLSGITSGISTLSGALSCTKKIGGSVASTASVTGSIIEHTYLAGGISAVSSPRQHIMRRQSCSYYRQVQLFEVIPGTLSVAWSLKGIATSTSSVLGTVSRARPLKGTISAVSSTQAVASVHWSLKGAISATSSTTGSIMALTYLAGSLHAVSSPRMHYARRRACPLYAQLRRLSIIPTSLHRQRGLVGSVSAIASLQGILSHAAPERGFYYAKLGTTILTGIEKPSFRITEEIDKIPSFEIDVANCSDNRTTIAAGITDVLTIYRRKHDVDTLMFTGIINADTIEYLSLERIRLIGYASYIDLNWRFHQHLNSEDAETVDKVFDYNSGGSPVWTDYTNAANSGDTFTLDSMDATTGWQVQAGMTSITVNTTTKQEGAGALNLIKNDNGDTDAYIEKSISSTNLVDCDIKVWLYLKDSATLNKISKAQIYLYDASNNYRAWDFTSLAIGWNSIVADTSTTPDHQSGTPGDLSAVTKIELDVDTNLITDLYAEGDVIADHYRYSSGSTVDISFDSVNDALYIGQGETFFGMQVKYSTKGVQAASTTVVFEYSKGSGVWATLDVLDETRAFTEDTGTYFITIPHKPSDWAKDTVNSVKKFWIRARLSAGSYTTSPALDRIKLTNTDVYRVYYFETSANSIMADVLAGTGYSMDATDVCPSDTISVVAEYETKLRFIAGVANALTWDDSGDKKAYQWWIDTSKTVHFKQKRGATLGDITSELTILNNVEDYFNLSNRLHFLGNYDGLNQLRAVVENTSSQDTHEIREHAVHEERHNNYIPLKEAAEKAMTYTKAPLQKIAATVTTKYWLDQAFEVGDTVTLHKDTWDVDSTAFQIVRADIGPRVTKVDMGISQEHLDGLKAGLQRQLDITGVRMHGSTLILQFGPDEMNYQRVDGTTTYPSKLKFEIPSDARYIHKVLISWKLGPYRSSVGGSSGETGSGSGHDHTGYTGSSSAHDHTGYTGAGGVHTPTELGKGAHSHTDAGYNTYYTLSGYLLSTKYTGYESDHTHSNPTTSMQNRGHTHSVPATDGPDDIILVVDDLTYGCACSEGCGGGSCVTGIDQAYVADQNHYHLNTGKNTGGISQSHTHTQGATGAGSSHRHDYPLASGTAFDYVRAPITTYIVLDTDPDHAHTHNLIVAHNDHLVASQAGESLTVATEPGESLPLTYDIKEIAGGTVMQLIVNGEDVTTVDGDGTDIVITGFTNTGSNTIELEPVVGSNTKGSASIEGRGVIFIETSSF